MRSNHKYLVLKLAIVISLIFFFSFIIGISTMRFTSLHVHKSTIIYNHIQSNLQAELEAEKQVCSTKKRALQIATDELAKNQETIKKHELIIEKLKKGIDWRTLVMLRMSDEKQRNLLTLATVEKLGMKKN